MVQFFLYKFCHTVFPGNALAGELDEAHMLLDAAERSRKGAEMEVVVILVMSLSPVGC